MTTVANYAVERKEKCIIDSLHFASNTEVPRIARRLSCFICAVSAAVSIHAWLTSLYSVHSEAWLQRDRDGGATNAAVRRGECNWTGTRMKDPFAGATDVRTTLQGRAIPLPLSLLSWLIAIVESLRSCFVTSSLQLPSISHAKTDQLLHLSYIVCIPANTTYMCGVNSKSEIKLRPADL